VAVVRSAVVRSNPVAVVPVVPVLSIDSVAVVRSLRWWLSFDRSGGGFRLIDYGGCGSITPVANLVAVVPVVPVLSIDSVAVVRSLRWWLSFDRSGGGCRSIAPVAVVRSTTVAVVRSLL